MRAILFRGKLKGNNEWIEGCVVHWGEKMYILNENDVEIGVADYYGVNIDKEVDPETVGQYAGLTDKNGVRIFEGDIVRDHKGEFCLVGYFNGGFSPFAISGWECEPDPTACEVVGNIYDNPKLLEDKQ